MKILFLTSYSTGQGHKSITEALCQQIKDLAPDAEISAIDGFAIGSKTFCATGHLYNTLAVHLPMLWEIIYRFADVLPRVIIGVTAFSMRIDLLKHIQKSKPDVIVCVHAVFVGATLRILEKNGFDIPIVSVVADLDNITTMWTDPHVHAVICPTEEAKKKVLAVGTPESKVKVLGFPIRSEFLTGGSHRESDGKGPLKALLVSGSQGSHRIRKVVKVLSDNHACHMRIITGHNVNLKKDLESQYADQLGTEIEVMGFTKEMDQYMRQADLLIARASPNVVMEAVNLCIPIVITDYFYGQEKKNPEFIEKHGLGIVCTDLKRLPDVVKGLADKNNAGLRAIQQRQANYRQPSAARETAEFILQSVKKS